VHALGWLAVVVGEAPGLPTLDGVGVLRVAEREAIDAAEEFLVRVRSALHLETGRKADRLHLEQQPSIARQMGFADEPGLPAVDGLMRALFEHARQVEHVTGAVLERFLEGSGGQAAGAGPFAASGPEEVIGAFAEAAEADRPLAVSALDRIEAMELPAEVTWSPRILEAFLRILRAGRGGVRALEAMDRIGLLARFVPAWAAVRCRPQRDPYHRFTVDVHLLEAFARMGRVLDDPAGEGDATLLRMVEHVADPDALRLGALLHDVGKTGEGRHVPVGARIAAEALDRMGVPAPTRDLALFMVERHLLLPDTATRRDLMDEDLILDVAATVATRERLAALYLLAVADAAATGPHAWTPWRQALIRELVAKVEHVLERGEMGTEAAERLERRADEIRALLAAEDPGAVERFLVRMPPTYRLAVEPEAAAGHFALVSPPPSALEVRTAADAGTRPGTYALTVVAADRPGLLSMIAGALSLAGLSILTAKVFTTEDDVAVDLFEVEGAFEPEVGEDRWRTFRQTLRKAMEGRLALEHRVAEKRSHYPEPRAEIPVRVEVDNEASDFFTVIEVGAHDRIGLLFDVTRTFAELQLDVHLAKVATFGARVVDAFYVRDVLGQKVTDPDHVAEIERAVRSRLEG
jgi:[protein-PII] uridylyltransferase